MNRLWLIFSIFFFISGSWLFYHKHFGMTMPLERSREGRPLLDHSFFSEEVIGKNTLIDRTELHLFVFLDFQNDCPVCIGEIYTWSELLSCPDYGLSLYVKDTLPSEELAELTQDFHSGNFELIRFSQEDPLSKLHRFGLFKVLYSAKQGVVDSAFGSYGPKEYEAFSDTINQLMDQLNLCRQPRGAAISP